jgi:two-component system NarL family sensor kinase
MLVHHLDRRLSHEELEHLIRQRTSALRSLSARLQRVQDEERRHLARDLHDSTGQILTALKIQLATLQECPKCGQPTSEILAVVNSLASQALEEIRTTSYLLYPPLLHEAGLASAAQWYIEGFAKRSNVQVSVSLALGDSRLQKTVETALFRILQESLTNIYRHSGSSSAEVRLRSRGDMVMLEVQDYGKGIPHALLDQFRRTGGGGGIGLSGMKERIEAFSGRLDITSSPRGTLVRATVPVTLGEGGSGERTESAGAAAA